MGQMLSIEDAAKIMDVHPRTVSRMIERGELEATKVGRVWRIAPAAINALTKQPMASNGHAHGQGYEHGPHIPTEDQILDPKAAAKRMSLIVLGEALNVIKYYCAFYNKELADLTADDLQRMVYLDTIRLPDKQPRFKSEF
jgi:excisionase family DNA binding protein